ncbi:MAG: methyl-accepting chemotaxis protein [Treponema sp.]|nr:methyl-accepting chemotaxis protein [Treponema sp.]
MINNYILTKIKRDEFEGEKLISKFRFIIALLYVIFAVLFDVLRHMEGLQSIPKYGFIPSGIFLFYSIVIYFYLNSKKSVRSSFKYICVFLDMTIMSISIFVSCGYPYLNPPIPYLSIWALFYGVLILLGAFRYSVKCAFISGVYAGLCYLTVIILRAKALDLPYFFELDDRTFSLSFPIPNETFRIMSMIVTGIITGVACKRHLSLFCGLIETQISASKTAKKTMSESNNAANTIRKSTEDIFHSSKEIFTTANSQAASIQEIESTMAENSKIAAEIAEKTSSVASVSMQMDLEVVQGFSALQRNVDQLEDIKDKNDTVMSGVISLSGKISKIRDIIEAINAITDQTKVIAFNAALEAASSGEYKKRFSVVSSEVDRLADNISALTKEIRKQADDIQSSSSSLIVSSKDSAENIKQGNNLIKELEDIFYDIRIAAEETSNQAQTITISTQKQQKSTEQISIAVNDITKGLRDFINSTKSVSSSAEELSKIIQKLEALLNNNNPLRTGA